MEQPLWRIDKEFIKIDMSTGERLDVALFDPRHDEIPEDYKESWDPFTPFYNPKWDFELNTWVEAMPVSEIIAPLRDLKAAELSDQCETVIKYGFYHEGDFFAFYDKDQMNFGQQLSLMLVDETILTTLWKTENNGIKQFTRQQFIDICKAGERHKRTNIGHFWQLKNYVLTHDFATVEELDAINFGTELAP